MQVIILDIRYPSVPITQLTRHHSCVNALAWAPHSASHLCTAGDDAQVQTCIHVCMLNVSYAAQRTHASRPQVLPTSVISGVLFQLVT
jgi:hypothetical protein